MTDTHFCQSLIRSGLALLSGRPRRAWLQPLRAQLAPEWRASDLQNDVQRSFLQTCLTAAIASPKHTARSFNELLRGLLERAHEAQSGASMEFMRLRLLWCQTHGPDSELTRLLENLMTLSDRAEPLQETLRAALKESGLISLSEGSERLGDEPEDLQDGALDFQFELRFRDHTWTLAGSQFSSFESHVRWSNMLGMSLGLIGGQAYQCRVKDPESWLALLCQGQEGPELWPFDSLRHSLFTPLKSEPE